MMGKNTLGRTGNAMGRRQFISKAGVVAVGMTVVDPHLVRGTSANSRVEVGCIGLGGRGSLIANMLSEHKGFQIVAMADYFPSVVQSAGERLGVDKKRLFSDLSGYRKMIAGGVDAVFCETPPYCFPDHVTEAITAGCHVYLAKPVACDVPGCLQVAKMGQHAAKNKQVFLVDFQTRTDPFFIEAVRRVHEGAIGQIGMLCSVYTDESFADPPKTDNIESRLRGLVWVNDVDLGGGYIVNCDIHAIDVALWIARAKPVSAMGSGRVVDPDAHGDSARVYSVTFQFEDGLILSHRSEHLRNVQDFTSDCAAYGLAGYLETAYNGNVWIRSNTQPYRGGQVQDLYVAGIQRNLDTFHKSIVHGIYDNPTVEPSVRSTLTTILGREAAHRNALVTWDEMIRENKPVQVDLSGLRS